MIQDILLLVYSSSAFLSIAKGGMAKELHVARWEEQSSNKPVGAL